MKCNCCKRTISSETFEALDGFCEVCYESLLPTINEMTLKNLKKLSESQPWEQRLDNGKIYCACYLPEMIVFDDKTNNFIIDFGDVGLKRIGNLIGLGGFYYDADYYFAVSPEKVIEAWKWFNIKTESNDDYWMAIEAETVWDFLRYNWRPFTMDYRESLIVSILSLVVDLRRLDSLKVDVTTKLSEIKNEKLRGNMETYRKLTDNEFHNSAKSTKNAFLRIRKIRQELANLSAETRLAFFAKVKGFNVIISKSPDLLISKKKVEVKRPKVKFVNARKQADMNNGMLFLHEDKCVIEDISAHIKKGFDQKADIVAIEVNHLEKRPISGFNSKWLGGIIGLEKALHNAINYGKKGTVLLFKCRREGYQGRVLRCKEMKAD
ncbi:MAG: hypothetical protein ACFFDI_27145 [Promethearchaeota archaeon]